MGNHEERHDSPRSCRNVLSKKCYGYTRLDKIRSEVIRKELEISGIQDVRLKYKKKLDQPPWKNGQYQTAETRPQLQTSRKKRPWTPQEWYTGYTRLDKIRSDVIRKELEISGIQDLGLKYKQNWINYLERTDKTRFPKHALNYKPRGRRDRGRTRKRWQCVDAGTGQTT